MTPSASTHPYKHHRFPGEMLSYAVWLYVRLCLSQRDVETGSVTDSCAMTPVAERSACQSGYSKEGSPWDTSHKLYGYSTGCEAEPETTGQAPFGRAKAAYWKINLATSCRNDTLSDLDSTLITSL